MDSDEEFMLAAGKGDLHAFEQIVLRHQTSAWNVAYRFLGDREDAADVVQNAFLRVLDAAPRYRPVAPFPAYLYRIVTHLCLDHTRKLRPLCLEDPPDTVDDAPSPLEALIDDERSRAVQAALKDLPSNQRAAVVLRYYGNLGYREIAVALGTSTKAVERLLARGRAGLETRLAEWLRM